MAIGTYISIITLNMNGLNAPTKRHRLAEWIQKGDPYICCLQETHFRPKMLNIAHYYRKPNQNYNQDYCTRQESHSKLMEK